ncbi:MAG: HAD-IIIC family phosphatase [Limisphaerales bacterium]
MYESEVNNLWETADAIPVETRQRWSEFSRHVTARSMISWGEHCTECAIPHCFLTCDLYQKRQVDWSCRRFTEGMVCVSGVDGIAPWLLKIQFKKWGKIWADGTTGLIPRRRATRIEGLNAWLGAVVRNLPVPGRIKKSIAWRFRQYRERWAKSRASAQSPDYFLIEVYNPADTEVSLTFYVRSRINEATATPFSARFIVPPGLHRMCFPVETIRASVDLSLPFHLEISPSDSEARPLLYFGCMDFVRDTSFVPARKTGSCKCIVWDLDNTIWDGILVEDGADRVRLKPGIKEIFAELDRRGILLSVVSKNNPNDAMPVLQRFGLDEYILKPQISWEPKGQGVRRIAQALNIGINSLLYVDDSPFERAEVSALCPEVQVIDAADANWLLWRQECQALQTAESAKRRLFYREEDRREEALQQAAGDYEAFLRDCKIQVQVLPFDEALLPRLHELAQRTNQMNFSGARYTREQLDLIRADKSKDSLAIKVEDRFGTYGVVGFAIMDRQQNMLTDMAFSCRIQSKRIEHAFLSHLLRRYPTRPFRARWRKTERNAAAGKVFDDLGFREVNQSDGVTELAFDAADAPLFDFISLKTETST